MISTCGLWRQAARWCWRLAAAWCWLGQWCQDRVRRRMVCRRVSVFTDKWTLIRAATASRLDFGEAECAACGRIWEAAVPHGVNGNLECPSCGRFAGQFTCLVEG